MRVQVRLHSAETGVLQGAEAATVTRAGVSALPQRPHTAKSHVRPSN